ncbi:tRNA (5-methylaminomethyl-2-thiouridine)(34)-methyltransferase MnmD [Rhodoferax sp. U11-2br]|uniref:tRNA (5-methylaminomethyl-2-thiouridine)(34)-methyltransferase MnmD n=1 Tax=Rhodoferax sp. U11-2br TaxID=2838878 RepID=UPI001BE72194|nr:tRNA (5-methylaminomethyl-2-thiouridine)(34)-methyltransferase MnmD [Rhodoferax sp. U11-2br]MBT3065604.1 tRNA (5-methylaminomethyl-2-thiouridine)(34)-methyltransferase MnmD [Rhodoferax sp. U11-2br]
MSVPESINWLEDGCPYSPRFQDRYHSCTGGLAQAAGVFLRGCGLPQRWHEQDHFTILETGFGLGQNFLATWAAWLADPQRCQQLHFVSVEAYPVAAADLVRAAQAAEAGLGELALPLVPVGPLADELAGVWQNLSPGQHHFQFAQGRVQLTLAVADVVQVLPGLDVVADAVFLDGFSPGINPDMWSAATLQAVAGLCRRGTTLATYTIARRVRDGLTQAGFAVKKCQGLPPKRDRLEAVFQGLDNSAASAPAQLAPLSA